MKTNETLPSVRIGVGIFGYIFHDPLSDESAALVEHLCSKRTGTEQDIKLAREMGFPYMTTQDLKGEYYRAEVISILANAGTKLDYLGYQVFSEADIERINEQLDTGEADLTER